MQMSVAPQRSPEPADILGMIRRSLTGQQRDMPEGISDREHILSIQAGTGGTAAVITTSRGQTWAIRVERIG